MGEIGGPGAPAAQAGLARVASFQPTFGTLVGGGAAIGLTKDLLGTKPKRRRRNKL